MSETKPALTIDFVPEPNEEAFDDRTGEVLVHDVRLGDLRDLEEEVLDR